MFEYKDHYTGKRAVIYDALEILAIYPAHRTIYAEYDAAGNETSPTRHEPEGYSYLALHGGTVLTAGEESDALILRVDIERDRVFRTMRDAD